MAEKSRKWSPYNYVSDNPICRIDPDGMADVIGSYGINYSDGNSADKAYTIYDAGSPNSNQNSQQSSSGDKAGATEGKKDAATAANGANNGSTGTGTASFPSFETLLKNYCSIRTLYVFEAVTPFIYHHIDFAHKELNQPLTLHFVGGALSKTNRPEALSDWVGFKRPPGWSVDEYPFASTLEGGVGASTALVPSYENSFQGGQMSGYRFGDIIQVVLVPLPNPSPVPVLITNPENKNIPTLAPVRLKKTVITTGVVVGGASILSYLWYLTLAL